MSSQLLCEVWTSRKASAPRHNPCEIVSEAEHLISVPRNVGKKASEFKWSLFFSLFRHEMILISKKNKKTTELSVLFPRCAVTGGIIVQKGCDRLGQPCRSSSATLSAHGGVERQRALPALPCPLSSADVSLLPTPPLNLCPASTQPCSLQHDSTHLRTRDLRGPCGVICIHYSPCSHLPPSLLYKE